MGRIVVLGSINMDIVALVRHHPRGGETVVSSDLQFIPGGKGANQAVAASRLRGSVHLIGKVGNDSFGKQLLDFLKDERLLTENLFTTDDVPTGTALVIVDEKSENSIVVSPGSNNKLSVADTKETTFSPEDISLATLEVPQTVTAELFTRTRAAGGTTILNAAPGISCDLFSLSDYLIVNEVELGFFSKRNDIPETDEEVISAMRAIRSDDKQIVVTTLGKKGLIALEEHKTITVPARVVRAVDTTAAGDCFVGAFATALSEKKELREVLEFANAAAALSVQKLGASTSLPKRSEVDAFL